MSTVFYGYRIEGDRLWEQIEEIRAYYRANGLLGTMAADLGRRLERGEDAAKVLDALHKAESSAAVKEMAEAELQLFPQADGSYIIRPLERGYFFHNAVGAGEWDLEDVSYDNRSEMSPEQLARRPLIESIETQIRSQHYLITPIIDFEWLSGELVEKISSGIADSWREQEQRAGS